MQSRLVLGSATYGTLTQFEVDQLLYTALESGINIVDTARGYENSEERIGAFLKRNCEIRVNSKCGLPNPSMFTPAGIKRSVEASLKCLGVEQINTLFVHSLPAEYLTEENISAMLSLKLEGKVHEIGYAGDGLNLGAAVKITSFDNFMATINIIDQSNFNQIRRIKPSAKVYFKLAMGQAVWTSLEWKNRIKSQAFIRGLFNKPPVPDSWKDYCARFSEFKLHFITSNFAEEFLKFALSAGSGDQFVILGTCSVTHIKEAVRIENELFNTRSWETARYSELWEKRSSLDWIAHTG